MFPQQDKKTVVTDGKNSYQGTISATKNIDLLEDGYVKLAAPMCRVFDGDDNSDLELPLDMFAWSNGIHKIHTTGEAFSFLLADVSTMTEDSGDGGEGSDTTRIIRWVSNNWFMNSTSAVYDYTGAAINTVYTSRIATALDFIALFVSRNTLVGRLASSVNVVNQYRASDFATTGQSALTLPANFAVTGLAFSNETMGVITKQRKNQGNAIFATWDGSDTSANRIFEVNDSYILDIAAYQSSWVILTSRGLLLRFNGGGFDELGRLQAYDLEQRIVDFSPTGTAVFGKILHVDGDKVYANCYSLPESAKSRKPYHPFYSGGAYVYDPKHGFYHTAAPSYSKYQAESITFASNIGTTSAAHFMETGDPVFSTSGDAEFTDSTTYYVIKLTSTTFSLATTYENALANTVMSITNGSYTLNYVKRYDFGIESVKLVDCGLIKTDNDSRGYVDSGAFPFFLGAKVHPNNLASTRVNTVNVSVPVMNNRGFFVLGKWQTQNMQDSWHGYSVKYSKLEPWDKIVLSAKVKDSKAIIVGSPSLFDTSAYAGESVTWDGSGSYFTTTADLTDAEEGDMVHVFAGPGAGQTAFIKTIAGNVTDGWEVTLDEALRGIVSGRISCVMIDKFKRIGEITSDDTEGVKQVMGDGIGPSSELFVELRGIGVKVSEIIPLSTPHQVAI